MEWNLIGHDWAVSLLREHLTRRQVRHAYLISGPQGVGRRSLALRLAQSLNCPNAQDGSPCRACRVCKQIEAMQYPDLSLVQRPEDKTQILVDQIRELQHSLSLAAYGQGWRVALLLRFEEANPAAQNALLKTLEEPNPRVVLLLTAESGEALLPTIVSRCETLRLRPAAPEVLTQALAAGWGVEPDQARLLAHISGGRPGAAIQMLQDPHHLQERQALLDRHLELIHAPRAERFAYADLLTKDKNRPLQRQALLAWLSFWRDVMLCAAGAAALPANLDYQPQIEALAARLGAQPARRAIAAIQRTQDLLRGNINARLALEVLMLDLPQVR